MEDNLILEGITDLKKEISGGHAFSSNGPSHFFISRWTLFCDEKHLTHLPVRILVFADVVTIYNNRFHMRVVSHDAEI